MGGTLCVSCKRLESSQQASFARPCAVAKTSQATKNLSMAGEKVYLVRWITEGCSPRGTSSIKKQVNRDNDLQCAQVVCVCVDFVSSMSETQKHP